MLAPAATGLGVPLFVTARSQTGVSWVVVTVLLFAALGSDVVAVTDELAVMVPAGTEDAMLTTTTMSATAPAARLGSMHVSDAVTVQVQPTGADTEEKVVFAGI